MVPYAYLGFRHGVRSAASMFNSTNIPGASSTDLTNARNPVRGAHRPPEPASRALGGSIRTAGSTRSSVRRSIPRHQADRVLRADSWRVHAGADAHGGASAGRADAGSNRAPARVHVTMASICGQSALATTGCTASATSSPQARRAACITPIHPAEGGDGRLQHGTGTLRAVIQRRLAADVQSGFLRTILGDPDQAVLRGGYAVAYERRD